MKFSQMNLTVNGSNWSFQPYDRGANGAFVYRKAGAAVHSPRVVVSSTTNDSATDKYVAQINAPRVCDPNECGLEKVLGTDLVKTELRFLATTSKQDREDQIDAQIALLQELRDTFTNREVIYA